MPSERRDAVVYFSGHPWDGVRGTDRHLATALSRQVSVLWVDPPVPVLAILRNRLRGNASAPSTGMDVIGDNICRVRVLGPPGLTRPVLRTAGGLYLRSRIARLVGHLDVDVRSVIVANPEGRFPRGIRGRKVYCVTDDWPAGAGMMGLSRRRIQR